LDRYLASAYSLSFLPKVEVTVCVASDLAEQAWGQITRAARTGRMRDIELFGRPMAAAFEI
jgi:nitrogen regulatory protein PII